VEHIRDAYWPAQLAVLAALLLYLALPEKFTLGPDWLVPVSEGVLLAALVVVTPYGRARQRPRDRHGYRRQVALALASVVAVINILALGQLVEFIVSEGTPGGYELILSGVEIWTTNLLIFAVLFWELDGGGPDRRRPGDARERRDFLFQQMTVDGFARWRPRFPDYLYTSFTNCTAFSPTDTMPLSIRVKMLMSVQGVTALVTVGVVVARAVGVLR
jgi:hypothetical protein